MVSRVRFPDEPPKTLNPNMDYGFFAVSTGTNGKRSLQFANQLERTRKLVPKDLLNAQIRFPTPTQLTATSVASIPGIITIINCTRES